MNRIMVAVGVLPRYLARLNKSTFEPIKTAETSRDALDLMPSPQHGEGMKPSALATAVLPDASTAVGLVTVRQLAQVPQMPGETEMALAVDNRIRAGRRARNHKRVTGVPQEGRNERDEEAQKD